MSPPGWRSLATSNEQRESLRQSNGSNLAPERTGRDSFRTKHSGSIGRQQQQRQQQRASTQQQPVCVPNVNKPGERLPSPPPYSCRHQVGQTRLICNSALAWLATAPKRAPQIWPLWPDEAGKPASVSCQQVLLASKEQVGVAGAVATGR